MRTRPVFLSLHSNTAVSIIDVTGLVKQENGRVPAFLIWQRSAGSWEPLVRPNNVHLCQPEHDSGEHASDPVGNASAQIDG